MTKPFLKILLLFTISLCGCTQSPSNNLPSNPSNNSSTIGSFYKLDGNTIVYGEKYPNPDPTRNKLHNWYIDAKLSDVHPSVTKEFLSIVTNESSFERGTRIMCFQPGFGFSGTVNGHFHEYLICLHCSNMDVFVDGTQTEDELVLTGDALKKLQSIYDRLWKNTEQSAPVNGQDDPH